MKRGHGRRTTCYTYHVGKKVTTKRPLPSYTEGELRDLSIKKMQDKAYSKPELVRLVRRAVKKPPASH